MTQWQHRVLVSRLRVDVGRRLRYLAGREDIEVIGLTQWQHRVLVSRLRVDVGRRLRYLAGREDIEVIGSGRAAEAALNDP